MGSPFAARALGYSPPVPRRSSLTQSEANATEGGHGTEHALRLKLAQLAATLESTTDGILVTDLERNVLRCNGRFRDMWRLTPDMV